MARDTAAETLFTKFDGNNLKVLRAIDSDTAPTTADDVSKGFIVGSEWLRISTAKLYVCSDASAGAATWNILN